MMGAGHGFEIGTCPAVERFGPGVFSTDMEEWRLTFSPGGRTAFWSISDDFFPVSRQATIVWSGRVRGEWATRQVVPFSGVYSDIDPFISPDGRALFFSTIRPVDGVERSDLDLWMVRRTPWGWSEPIHLGNEVNSPSDELYPSVDLWGNLYFGSDRAGQWDIWRARRRHDGSYGPPKNVGPGVNTADFWEFNPEITPDGRTLLFASLDRPDGFGAGDLYISHLRHGQFTPARNLGPCVNTAADEYHPTLSHGRRWLYFVRHTYEPGTTGDFYRIRT
ncbi:MAG: hypothetical protein GEU99_16910 [Luteitalea sp.]|nr:hypothetical protein [Luteitalea sp.]